MSDYTKTMTKIKTFFLFFLSLALLTSVVWLIGGRNLLAPDKLNFENSPTPIPSITGLAPFTARFEIYTNGTKRVFTAAMYHNQSPEVYLEAADPGLIYVGRTGITWEDFFATLPFSLDEKCLVTGTKQTFCNNRDQRLYFYLNGSETSGVLPRQINPNDSLRVEYK